MTNPLRISLIAALATAAAVASADTPSPEPGGPGETARAKQILERTEGLIQSSEAILVRFRPTVSDSAKATVRASIGGAKLRSYTIVPGLELISTPGGVERALVALKANGNVAYAEPDYVIRPTLIPNDPSYPSLWGMNAGNNFDINAPEAWDIFTGDPNFIIADIDTGMQLDHPDLVGNLWTNTREVQGNGVDDDGNGYADDIHGWNFYDHNNNPSDTNGHGTHTAGTIGASGNNGIGVTGVNWRCKIMPLRFIGPTGGFESDAVAAVQYAVNNGARISNNSWGSNNFMSSLYDAMNQARSAGHLFIAAAGNNGMSAEALPFYPACFDLDNIISVAAIDSTGNLASFSNYGTTSVDVAAPGDSIYSTYPTNSFTSLSGTSMATPHVTGVAALVWAYNPSWSYQQVRDRIFNTVRPMGNLPGMIKYGGTVNAYAALQGTGSNGAPVVTIHTPTNGARGYVGSWYFLSDTANDSVEGDISSRTDWSSDIQGYLGTGAGIWRNGLSAGTHHITATVRDSRGLIGSSAVFIVSVPNVVNPTSFSLFRGVQAGGSLSDLWNSDDSRLVVKPGIVMSSGEAPIQVILEATSLSSSPSSIQFYLEAQVSNSNLQQKLELYNFAMASYVTVDTRSGSLSDSGITATVSTNASQFVSPGSQIVRARISYRTTGPILSYPWQARIDRSVWSVFP